MTCTQSAILGQPAIKFSRHFVGTTDWINFSSVLLPALYIWATQKERWLFEGITDRIFLGISVKVVLPQSTGSFNVLNARAKALTAFIFGQMTTHIYTLYIYTYNNITYTQLIKPQKAQPARNQAYDFKKWATEKGKKPKTADFWRNYWKLKHQYIGRYVPTISFYCGGSAKHLVLGLDSAQVHPGSAQKQCHVLILMFSLNPT